jgi:hypothetical protein
MEIPNIGKTVKSRETKTDCRKMEQNPLKDKAMHEGDNTGISFSNEELR